MENLEKIKKPERRAEPFSYKDIGKPHPETGEFIIEESSGEKRIVRPARPPLLEKIEEEEARRAGITKLIDQLPTEVRQEVREKARLEAAEIINKKQHLASRTELDKEFHRLCQLKEWELAAKWLESQPEKKPNEKKPL